MNDLRLALATEPAQFKAKTGAEQLVDRLVTAIALGVLLPGQKLLPERDFAAQLEVSRATLRDALDQLASMGYVTIRRGRSGGVWINSAWGPQSGRHLRRRRVLDHRRAGVEVAGIGTTVLNETWVARMPGPESPGVAAAAVRLIAALIMNA